MSETLTIDEVYTKEDGPYPVLLNFQNGYPNEDFDVEAAALLDENGRKTIATELGGLVYDGQEVEEDLGRTMLLVRNRETGKVRLIEVGCADLKPVFKIDLDTSQHLETSKLELSRKFGSKKQKQIMEQREKLKVNVKSVTEQMEKVTDDLSGDKLDLSAYNKGDSDDFYMPPIDREATKVENVYDLDKILTEDEYETIYSELETKDYKSELVPWVKSVVSAKKDITPRLTVLAVYANALLKFSALKAADIKKKTFIACSHSATLNKIIIDNFTTFSNGNRNRPIQYRDKSMCYFIVFMMILNNFKFDLEQLCTVLKMTPTTIGLKVRVLGGTIVNAGDKKIVQLKLPLTKKTTFRRKSARF